MSYSVAVGKANFYQFLSLLHGDFPRSGRQFSIFFDFKLIDKTGIDLAEKMSPRNRWVRLELSLGAFGVIHEALEAKAKEIQLGK